MLDGWDEAGARALLAAMADVAGAAPHEIDDGVRGPAALVEGAARHLFDFDGTPDDLPAASPDAVAAALTTDDQRALASEVLVLVPYADTTVAAPEVARVDAYAAALGTDPKTLHGLREVRDGHIRRLLIDYSRRASANVGPHQLLLRKLVDEVHQYVGDKKVAARYAELEGFAEGSLGRTFFTFYRERDFPLPGEHKSLGEAVTSHDCCHILSGFNTDGTGEIDVAGFEAGMKRDAFGFSLVMEVVLDFQLGIDFGVGLVGYKPKVGELDPDQLMVGIRRGLGCSVDLMGPDWDFWAVADRPVPDLRAEYGITDVTGTHLPPPSHPATAD